MKKFFFTAQKIFLKNKIKSVVTKYWHGTKKPPRIQAEALETTLSRQGNRPNSNLNNNNNAADLDTEEFEKLKKQAWMSPRASRKGKHRVRLTKTFAEEEDDEMSGSGSEQLVQA